ncbi:unnamed protein product, partial [Anisakis simplex]
MMNERLAVDAPKLESTGEVPELDESIFTQEQIGSDFSYPTKTPTLMQQMAQPLAMGRPLLPLKTNLLGRRAVRCKQCDHSLCKSEYNPNSIKFK